MDCVNRMVIGVSEEMSPPSGVILSIRGDVNHAAMPPTTVTPMMASVSQRFKGNVFLSRRE